MVYEPSTSPERAGTFRSFDGEDVAYSSYGEGTTLLCLNGLACDAMSWRYLVDYFAPSHQVVVFDYRGHGRSPAPRHPEAVSVETNARDALCLMNHLQLRQAVLVGHSMGGQVALEMFNQEPERVRAFVLILCAFREPLSTLRDLPARHVAQPLLRLCCRRPELVRRALEKTAAGPVGFAVGRAIGMFHPAYCDSEDWLHYLEHFCRFDHRTYGHMALSLQQHDAKRSLWNIRLPTLIVGGERDSISPVWIARDLHRRIAGAELLVLPRGSHIGHLEEHGLLHLRMEKFFRERLDGSAA